MPDPFLDLADESRQRTAMRTRIGHRASRLVATELATFTGTLRDLAERKVRVAVQTSSSRIHRGVLVSVGIDHVVVRRIDGPLALVVFDTVRSVRPHPGSVVPATGHRQHSDNRTLLEALDRLLEADREVVVLLRDIDEPLRGVMTGLGEDVLTLRTPDEGPTSVYVPVAAVRELIIAP